MPDADRLTRTHVAPRAALEKTFAHLRTCLRALGWTRDRCGRVRLLNCVERAADRCHRLACQIETETDCAWPQIVLRPATAAAESLRGFASAAPLPP